MLTNHGGEVGGGGTSDVDGDGFGVLQDFEIPTNDNDGKKLFNEYDETETRVCNDIDNASLSGSTSEYLPGSPAGWYPPGAPDD